MHSAEKLYPFTPDARTTSLAIHWTLRISVFLCFVGHGAFGLRQKIDWLAFIRPFGFSDEIGMILMPVIGTFDISLGILALFRPTRGALMLNVFWGIFTACLRPIVGMSVFEALERAGNYGPALVLLLGCMHGSPTGRIGLHDLSIPSLRLNIYRVLILTTSLLLLGHGGLAASGKPMLISHWASIGIGQGLPAFTQWVGAGEIIIAFVLLFRPAVSLCLVVCLWKIFTECLFLTAGAPFWEVVERGGSYGAPLALAILTYWWKQQRSFAHTGTPWVAAQGA